MRKVEKWIKHIEDEIHGALSYAEKYVFFKNSKPQWASMYSEMAMQELNHAENLRMIGQAMMDELAWVPEEDTQAWENSIYKAAEKVALVKMMLSK